MVCSKSGSSYSESSLEVSSPEDGSFILTYSNTLSVDSNCSKSKVYSCSWYDGFGIIGATKLIELSERPKSVSSFSKVFYLAV